MLKKKILKIEQLTEYNVNEMFTLMNIHYNNINKSQFKKDLFEKDGVLVLFDENDKIQGFSTYQILNTEYNGLKIKAVFSGDSVVHHKYWGGNYVFKLVGELLAFIKNNSELEVYWFLISKGYKTYQYLPLLFNEFYPNYRIKTPEKEKELIYKLSKAKFPDSYDIDSGIIKSKSDSLRNKFNIITERKRKNKNIAFFLNKNPNHIIGYELPCITEIKKENLSKIGNRFIKLI